jgi:hypothetical protein
MVLVIDSRDIDTKFLGGFANRLRQNTACKHGACGGLQAAASYGSDKWRIMIPPFGRLL